MTSLSRVTLSQVRIIALMVTYALTKFSDVGQEHGSNAVSDVEMASAHDIDEMEVEEPDHLFLDLDQIEGCKS
jgi:hypothetical protein